MKSYKDIMAQLPDHYNPDAGIIDNLKGRYWTNGSTIYCISEEEADDLENYLTDNCTECVVDGEYAVKAMDENERWEYDDNTCISWAVHTIDYADEIMDPVLKVLLERKIEQQPT